jgi:hypothetical protein
MRKRDAAGGNENAPAGKSQAGGGGSESRAVFTLGRWQRATKHKPVLMRES